MKRISTALFLTMIFVTISLAQTPTGRLLGVVSSPDGVLPNAAITVLSNQTGKTLNGVADGDGSFNFAQLEPGEYTVTVTASG
ncbi:MAG TPA: carboxypeptidase-like regulatory domain-containing protein, partial [Pyrinomonadaceae bacterium]|nr:carboxypeptidase-like regulatory domain-containing protein [Pyrinomonadaceae bacterium]